MPRPSKRLEYMHHWIDTGGVRLPYTELPSDGPPLLLVHGIGMDWRVWQATSRRLSPYFHLYMPDLRGHGESDKPEHGYTLPHYASDIEEMLDQLGLQNVILVGSSLGGMVVASVEAPEDIVRGRVLVDPPITGGPTRDPEMLRTILKLKHEPTGALADYLQAQNPGAGRLYLEAMSEMWHHAADGVIVDVLDDVDAYWNIEPALRWNTGPTLILRADQSRGGVLTDIEARRAAHMLPKGTLIYVPGAGHAIHADKPAEFTNILLDFAGITSGSPVGPRLEA
jgi:pimeloyl-ACP methyl ester carboxylesterase